MVVASGGPVNILSGHRQHIGYSEAETTPLQSIVRTSRAPSISSFAGSRHASVCSSAGLSDVSFCVGPPSRHRASRGRRVRQVTSMGGESTTSVGGRRMARFGYSFKEDRPIKHCKDRWQVGCRDVKSRVAALFSSYTMHDVTFDFGGQHHLPAHKFILGAASPVFYEQLYMEESIERAQMDPRLGRRRSSVSESPTTSLSRLTWRQTTTISITDVPFEVFYDFLQYIYTDTIEITLDNALHLIFLADNYRVAGLSERCVEYIRKEIVPASTFRVMHIVDKIMLKLCLSSWKDVIEQTKQRAEYQALSLAQRRAYIAQKTSVRSTRTASLAAYLRNSSDRGQSSGHSSVRSMSRCSSIGGSSSGYDSGEAHTDYDENMALDMASTPKKKGVFATNVFDGMMGSVSIASLVEELSLACWKCVQTETEAVLSSDTFLDQDIHMVRRILAADNCSAAEIVLFRFVNKWAEHRCKAQDLEPTSNNKRTIIGQETLSLLRFPVMTTEQLQWEVVPTGVLEYDDVQKLLQHAAGHSQLTRFDNEPRFNPKHTTNLASLKGLIHSRTTSKEVMHQAVELTLPDTRAPSTKDQYYCPVYGDAVDELLGAALLEMYLKDTVADAFLKDGVRLASSHGVRPTAAQNVETPRLPPISPPISPLSLSARATSTLTLGASRAKSCHAETKRLRMQLKVPSVHGRSQMVLGYNSWEESARNQEVASKERSQPPDKVRPSAGHTVRPTDFFRIAHGLYRYKGTRLAELWLEGGEVMAVDHGPNAAVTDTDLGGGRFMLMEELRRTFGLGVQPPLGFGSPIHVFLSRT